MGNHVLESSYVDFYSEKGKHTGILSWLLTTDHKRIGILYLISLTFFFCVGATLGILMRLEMLTPGETIMGPQTYNSLFTIHGLIMIFLFIIPGIPPVFGNFFLPIQIGAKDVAFPRLNLLSWYLYISGGIMAILSLFLKGGPIDTGWTFYVPYSLRSGTDVSWGIFAAFILGFSSILTGLNFITTIHRMRAPGMSWFKMPLFPWSLYATGWIQVLATPIIGITILLVMVERFFRIGVFDPVLGGDPILYQHLFWTYSHPAVYIMILPAMGVVSEIIVTFSHRTIFGYKAIVFSSLAIAFVGYFVWGHHMFTSGMSDMARYIFSFLTFIVALPSGIKIFNWVTTMYKGSIDPKTPFLFVMAFIFLFSIGGLTGLILGSLATDVHLTDTYFVVAHFHFVVFGGAGFIFFGALHYWFPKMFGKMYNEKISKIALGMMTWGFLQLYFPFFILGYEGMPRRYFDYLPQFQTLHIISTVGSWILVSGIILMLYNLIHGLRHGKKAEVNPWGGVTLEWTVPSPPPLENFENEPFIGKGPSNYPALEEAKSE
jgi:cytochrome c oxidase subunit 1